jgi:hypothetical protein
VADHFLGESMSNLANWIACGALVMTASFFFVVSGASIFDNDKHKRLACKISYFVGLLCIVAAIAVRP